MANTAFARWTTLFLLITTLATVAADVSPTRLCRRATDPNACQAIIASHLAAAGMTSTKTTNVSSPVLLRQFLTAYARHMAAATSRFSKVAGGDSGHPREKMAFADCSELISLSIDQVKDAIKALAAARTQSSRRRRVRAAEAHTYLSAVLTNHVTCTDGLTPPEKSPANRVLEDLISRARVALAILAEIRGQNDDEEWKQFKRPRCPHRRRRRQPRVARKCPKWVTSRDRDLLRRKGKEIKADFVVSKDDDADFSTLQKAVDAVEEGREKRVVIYVKEGVYNEYVEVGPGKKNVMIVGDGANETVFTGSHNYVDNYTTFNSFTLASKAPKFILQDLSVWNTAGAKKHQAVALRVGGDKSIINRCQIVGYQDTLYAHSQRQFYRDCTIKGTVDFIFGNAAAVFQNCNIVSRKPMSSQQNMVTAQGRVDPNQNTGISLQSCGIVPGQDLKPESDEIQTYLGRPWKKYSRTMVMESYIAGHIDPAGWHPWSGDDYLNTLWFGEYDNRGPGSKTEGRVGWGGYHKVEKSSVAADFTVKKLLETEEDRWVANSGVDCTEGLVNN